MAYYAKAGTHSEIGLMSIGEQLIRDAFRQASYAFSHTVTSLEQSLTIQQSLLFVNGSGMEIAIEMFGLPYDGDVLRSTFQRCLIRSSQ